MSRNRTPKKKNEERRYDVEHIWDRRIEKNGKKFYLASWVGYPDKTWEPLDHLEGDIPKKLARELDAILDDPANNPKPEWRLKFERQVAAGIDVLKHGIDYVPRAKGNKSPARTPAAQRKAQAKPAPRSSNSTPARNKPTPSRKRESSDSSDASSDPDFLPSPPKRSRNNDVVNTPRRSTAMIEETPKSAPARGQLTKRFENQKSGTPSTPRLTQRLMAAAATPLSGRNGGARSGTPSQTPRSKKPREVSPQPSTSRAPLKKKNDAPRTPLTAARSGNGTGNIPEDARSSSQQSTPREPLKKTEEEGHRDPVAPRTESSSARTGTGTGNRREDARSSPQSSTSRGETTKRVEALQRMLASVARSGGATRNAEQPEPQKTPRTAGAPSGGTAANSSRKNTDASLRQPSDATAKEHEVKRAKNDENTAISNRSATSVANSVKKSSSESAVAAKKSMKAEEVERKGTADRENRTAGPREVPAVPRPPLAGSGARPAESVSRRPANSAPQRPLTYLTPQKLNEKYQNLLQNAKDLAASPLKKYWEDRAEESDKSGDKAAPTVPKDASSSDAAALRDADPEEENDAANPTEPLAPPKENNDEETAKVDAERAGTPENVISLIADAAASESTELHQPNRPQAPAAVAMNEATTVTKEREKGASSVPARPMQIVPREANGTRKKIVLRFKNPGVKDAANGTGSTAVALEAATSSSEAADREASAVSRSSQPPADAVMADVASAADEMLTSAPTIPVPVDVSELAQQPGEGVKESAATDAATSDETVEVTEVVRPEAAERAAPILPPPPAVSRSDASSDASTEQEAEKRRQRKERARLAAERDNRIDREEDDEDYRRRNEIRNEDEVTESWEEMQRNGRLFVEEMIKRESDNAVGSEMNRLYDMIQTTIVNTAEMTKNTQERFEERMTGLMRDQQKMIADNFENIKNSQLSLMNNQTKMMKDQEQIAKRLEKLEEEMRGFRTSFESLEKDNNEEEKRTRKHLSKKMDQMNDEIKELKELLRKNENQASDNMIKKEETPSIVMLPSDASNESNKENEGVRENSTAQGNGASGAAKPPLMLKREGRIVIVSKRPVLGQQTKLANVPASSVEPVSSAAEEKEAGENKASRSFDLRKYLTQKRNQDSSSGAAADENAVEETQPSTSN